MWARPTNYQILWTDASGVIASPQYGWDELVPISRYVYSLYKPPDTHVLRDDTILPPPNLLNKTEPLRWSIKGEGSTIFRNCTSLFVGSSWGRRTNVWHNTEDGNVVVIKDAYRDTSRRFKEDKLLKKIHSHGIFPGVVRLLSTTIPYTPFKTVIIPASPQVPIERPEREKLRLFLGSYGEEFRAAKTVRDILMATYDALESGQFHPFRYIECTDNDTW